MQQCARFAYAFRAPVNRKHGKPEKRDAAKAVRRKSAEPQQRENGKPENRIAAKPWLRCAWLAVCSGDGDAGMRGCRNVPLRQYCNAAKRRCVPALKSKSWAQPTVMR